MPRRAGGAGRVRRLAERLLLGSVMALIAVLLDRRLRRAFERQEVKQPGDGR